MLVVTDGSIVVFFFQSSPGALATSPAKIIIIIPVIKDLVCR